MFAHPWNPPIHQEFAPGWHQQWLVRYEDQQLRPVTSDDQGPKYQQCEAPKIAKLVQITPITMGYSIYSY